VIISFFQRLVERLAQCGDDVLRCAFGREDAAPDIELEVRCAGLLGGRHVRQRRQPFVARHHQPLDQPAFDARRNADSLLAVIIDVAADQIVHRRSGAAIGDQGRVQVEQRVEQQASHMRGGADATVGLLHVRAVRLHVGNECLEIVDRQVLFRRDGRRRIGGKADRLEIRARVVTQVRVKHRRRHVRAHADRHDGVAVRIGRRGARGAERAAGAADVLDDDALVEMPAHAIGGDARHGVARPTGRERHDHHDRPRRVTIRRIDRRDDPEQREQGRAGQK
jgi:hypothetical protein